MKPPISPMPLAINSTHEGNYNLRIRHPERTEIYHDYAERSAVTRRQPTALLDIPFGSTPSSRVDIFLPDTPTPAPLLIFIHGGYWRALDKRDFSFVADAYLAAGVAVAMPNYALAPQASVSEIVAEVCAGIAWLAGAEGSRLGYDASRILVSGHSAGGHMAATAVRSDRIPLLEGKLRGCVCLSGLFDLEPLLHTSVNHDLHMTSAEARALSVYDAELIDAPLLLAAGGLETVGFQEQSLGFARHCRARGRAAEAMLVAGRNHFDLVDEFADSGSSLFRKTLGLLCGQDEPTFLITETKEN